MCSTVCVGLRIHYHKQEKKKTNNEAAFFMTPCSHAQILHVKYNSFNILKHLRAISWSFYYVICYINYLIGSK